MSLAAAIDVKAAPPKGFRMMLKTLLPLTCLSLALASGAHATPTSLSAGNGEGSRDRILDFDVGDRIDIDEISREFANQFEDALVEEGIRRFVLMRDSAEFSEPGQLRIQYEDLDDGSSVTIIEGNLDDDADTEFQIELVGHHDMADDQFYHR